MKSLRLCSTSLLLACLFACASNGHATNSSDLVAAKETSEKTAPAALESNQRLIAIGDIHGDAKQFIRLLREIELIDKKQRWTGGDTHFVQLGDIPDRGPDSRKVMDLLIDLQEQAAEQGGSVTVLIGNHEAMMMIGDLRYVHEGEYASFKDRNSVKRRKAYYQQTVERLKATMPPNELPRFDRAYRKAWEARFPLGYVEHRLAWAPTGEYGKWVLSRPAVVQIGDTLFAHGGISPRFAQMSISEMNTRVRTALAMGDQIPENSIVEDEDGPLWDRGWVRRLQNEQNTVQLNQVLAEFKAARMVVAHTPLAPIILPRFGGKLLVADVGLAGHYGHGFAALEIVGDKTTMLLGDKRLEIPNDAADFDAYFDAAEALVTAPEKIARYRRLVAEAQQKALEKKSAGGVEP